MERKTIEQKLSVLEHQLKSVYGIVESQGKLIKMLKDEVNAK